MSELIYLPKTPRRDDPFAAMVVQQNLEYVVDLLNGLRAVFFVGLALPFFQSQPVSDTTPTIMADFFYYCNGGAIPRSGDTADLFSVIGTGYGGGDGSTTFNLPDLRGRTMYGQGTNAALNTVGESEGQAVNDRTPLHYHDTYWNPTNAALAVAFAYNGGGGGFKADSAGTGPDWPIGSPRIGTNLPAARDTGAFLSIGGWMIMYRLPF